MKKRRLCIALSFSEVAQIIGLPKEAEIRGFEQNIMQEMVCITIGGIGYLSEDHYVMSANGVPTQIDGDYKIMSEPGTTIWKPVGERLKIYLAHMHQVTMDEAMGVNDK